MFGNDPRLPNEHSLCVAELRGNGGYTMFPGSLHPDTGELITWDTLCPDALPEKSWDELERLVGLVSFLAVVVRFYPQRGLRDEFCMALAGTLLRSGILNGSVEAVDRVLEVVTSLAHDEEHRQREKAKATWRKMEAGEAVTGFPRMIQLLGFPQEAGRTLRT